MRNLIAWLLHRVATRLNGLSMAVQGIAFWLEFGAGWRSRRDHHYREKLTRKHFEMNR